MTRKSASEQLSMLEMQIKQLQERRNVIAKRATAQKRKARNHRLIKIGALVEAYAKTEIYDMASFESYLEQYGYAIAKSQPNKTTIIDIVCGIVDSGNIDDLQRIPACLQDRINMPKIEEIQRIVANIDADKRRDKIIEVLDL